MDYKQKVYDVVQKIPKGRVLTYGAVAKMAGTSPRAVGRALHNNPDPERIPCHRVVDRNGRIAENFAFSSRGRPAKNRSSRRVRIEPRSREARLGGGGAIEQRRRLVAEGVSFRDATHVDLEKHQWQ